MLRNFRNDNTFNLKEQERLYGRRSSKLDTEEQVERKRTKEKEKEVPGRGNSINKGIDLRRAEGLVETEQFRFGEAYDG